MSETIVKHELPIPVPVSNGGGRGPVAGFPDHDAGGGPTPGRTRQVYRTGMWMGLVAISMFFISFTSAYIVRGGMGEDWQALSLPPVLWLTTVLLAASSATLEWTRKALQEGRREACNRWLLATVALGMAFLAGQVVAWKQLSALGIYVATNPSSSFFYLLTAAHGIHLLGGLVALFYISMQALRYRLGPARRTAVDVTAIYWHFMDGLWIYIFLLLTLWR